MLIQPFQVLIRQLLQKRADPAPFILPRVGIGNMEVALRPGAGDIEQPTLFLDVTAVEIAVIFVNSPPMREDIVLACDQKYGMELEPFGGMDRGQADPSILGFIVNFIFSAQRAVFQELLYSFLAFGYAEKLAPCFPDEI